MALTYRPGGFLPGGYPYTDPRTGRKFDGFDAGGGGDQVLRIQKYRLNNPRIFPEPEWSNKEFIAKQLLEQQVTRLGGDKRFFIEINPTSQAANKAAFPAQPKAPVIAGKCSCGGDLETLYCKTCGGKRVVGYRCLTCKKEVKR